MSDVINLMPRLRLKARSECKHGLGCTVDPRAASLTCDDCGIEIDPWVYIRWIAEDTLNLETHRDAVIASIEASIKDGNEKVAKLNAEISRLDDFKRKLYDEELPSGQLLGSAMHRAAMRKTRSKR